MAKEIYYTIENGEKKLTWIARDTETKEVVKEFTDMIEGLKFVNKSGINGVYWDKQAEKYKAFIFLKGKKIYLGSYKELADAAKARKEAEEKYYKPIIDKYKKQ